LDRASPRLRRTTRPPGTGLGWGWGQRHGPARVSRATGTASGHHRPGRPQAGRQGKGGEHSRRPMPRQRCPRRDCGSGAPARHCRRRSRRADDSRDGRVEHVGNSGRGDAPTGGTPWTARRCRAPHGAASGSRAPLSTPSSAQARSRKCFAPAAWPSHQDTSDLGRPTQPNRSRGLRACIAASVCTRRQSEGIPSRRISTQAPRHRVHGSRSGAARARVAAADLIDQEPRGSIVVDHNQVAVAIVVDVAKGDPATDLGQGEDGPRLRRDIREAPSPRLAKSWLAGATGRVRCLDRLRMMLTAPLAT